MNLLKGGAIEQAESEVDFRYEGAPDTNDTGFDKGTFAERPMPALSALKQSNMERMSTYTTDSNRAKTTLISAGKVQITKFTFTERTIVRRFGTIIFFEKN